MNSVLQSAKGLASLIPGRAVMVRDSHSNISVALVLRVNRSGKETTPKSVDILQLVPEEGVTAGARVSEDDPPRGGFSLGSLRRCSGRVVTVKQVKVMDVSALLIAKTKIDHSKILERLDMAALSQA